MLETLRNFWESTGIAIATASPETLIKYLIMYVIIGVLLYLAIGRKFEPMLLLPIAFGMLLANIPGQELIHTELFFVEHPDYMRVLQEGGLIDMLYLGVKLGIYPSLIFLGIGAMTDFSPLIANPKSLMLGAAAQLGVFVAYGGAIFLGFSGAAAAAIAIIGGADGPTAILVTKELAPTLLGAIAIAAYSYMALIPMIQPPIMKLVTTKKERSIKMTALRKVSKKELILFPIIVTGVVCLILPSAAPLIGFLMLGNLFNVTGVVDRLSKTAQNELINIVTICLGVSGWSYCKCGIVPYPAYGMYYYSRTRCLLLFDAWRTFVRKAYVLAYQRENQSPYRFCGCFRCPYGGACLPDCRAEGGSFQLSSDARHGPECCWCYWLCCCRRMVFVLL